MSCCGVEQFLSSGSGGGGGPFSNDLLPTADNTYDLGSPLFRWQDLFLAGDIGSAVSPINELYWGDGTRLGHLYTSVPNNSVIVSAESNHALEFMTNNVTRWTIPAGTPDLVASVPGAVAMIRTNTVDGADNKRLALTAGGDADAARSGYIYLYGNENSGTGIVEISAGSVSGSKVNIIAANGSANAEINFNLNAASWAMREALNRDLIALGTGTRRVRSAVDTVLMEFRGGSGTDNTTGGALSTYGNSHATFPGRTLLETGAVAAAPLILQTSGTGSILFNTNSVTKRTLDSAGLDTLKSHANYTGSGESTFTAAVNTTDATQTNLTTITLADNTTYRFKISVAGRFNSTTAKGVVTGIEYGAYRNNAGAAVEIAAPTILQSQYGASGYDVTADVSGNTVRIRVTGAGGETVSWVGSVSYEAVSTAA